MVAARRQPVSGRRQKQRHQPGRRSDISTIITMQDRLEALKAFYEEDPSDPFTRFALAQEYLKRGDAEEGLRFFEQLVEDDPDYVGTYYHLGKLYESLGRRDDALRTYRQGIQTAQRQRDAHARAELQDALMKAEGVGFDD